MSKVTMLNMAGKEAGADRTKRRDLRYRAEPECSSCSSKKHFSQQKTGNTVCERPELKSEEEAGNLSDRREQAATDREAQQTLHR